MVVEYPSLFFSSSTHTSSFYNSKTTTTTLHYHTSLNPNQTLNFKSLTSTTTTFKMYTKNILVAAFATLAAAAPTARSTSDVLGLIATHSGNINVHLRSINTSGLKFWIGKETTTYCPTTNCPNGTYTQLLASADSPSVSLNVVVPGGQQAYVADDGSLSVTQAHSASTGTNGLRVPFSYTPAASEGTVGQLSFNGNGFVACPSGEESVYQIFAAGYPGFVAPEGCIGVGLATSVVDSAPVWQYI
jgi:hypothetical protein